MVRRRGYGWRVAGQGNGHGRTGARIPVLIAYRTISSWRLTAKPCIVAPVQPKDVFARNVRAERERQGLTQEQLADRADGLDEAQLRRVELAVYDPQLLMIVRIARGLDVPAAALLKGL